MTVNDIQKVLIICPRITNSDGIGRHALALKEHFSNSGMVVDVFTVQTQGFFAVLQALCQKFYMSHIFDIFFIIISELFRRSAYRQHLSVSPSVICSPRTDQIHFSSCHIHSLSVANERWKLYFSPRNMAYILYEFVQYKTCKQAIFISKQQQLQFRFYYGDRNKSTKVIPPVLSKGSFRLGHIDKDFGHNYFELKRNGILFIGYNFRMKGLSIAQCAANSLSARLDIIGDDKKYLRKNPKGNHRFLGPKEFVDIEWSSYGFFIFPTYSDSYAFVIQEAVRNGLIPLCSSQAGGSEILSDFGLRQCVIEQQPKIDPALVEEIAKRYQMQLLELRNLDKKPPKYNVNSATLYSESYYAENILNFLTSN